MDAKRSDSGWSDYLDDELAKLDQRNLRRYRVITQHLSESLVRRHALDLVNFGGNDYLGLRQHPEIIATSAAACADGLGSGASPAVTGYGPAQAKLEQRLAQLNHTQDALIFPSGFAGNVATLASLLAEGDAVYSDELNHASLIDGCRLSKATRHIYPHNNIAELERTLIATRHLHSRALIVTESIFSMDGDAAPLVALAELAERFECGFVVDEAHATGVYGATGSGLVEELNLGERVLCKLGTLSKAVGCLGGFACGSHSLIEFIANSGRAYMFSTALPSSVLKAASTAIDVLSVMQESRSQLRSNAIALREILRAQGWTVLGYDSPIIPIVIGDQSQTLAISERLRTAGLFVPAIRPPTVPAGKCRLRISLSVSHTASQINQLTSALKDCP